MFSSLSMRRALRRSGGVEDAPGEGERPHKDRDSGKVKSESLPAPSAEEPSSGARAGTGAGAAADATSPFEGADGAGSDSSDDEGGGGGGGSGGGAGGGADRREGRDDGVPGAGAAAGSSGAAAAGAGTGGGRPAGRRFKRRGRGGASASDRGIQSYKFLACIREDHGKAIYNVAFCSHPEFQNYFATIGSNRVRALAAPVATLDAFAEPRRALVVVGSGAIVLAWRRAPQCHEESW